MYVEDFIDKELRATTEEDFRRKSDEWWMTFWSLQALERGIYMQASVEKNWVFIVLAGDQ